MSLQPAIIPAPAFEPATFALAPSFPAIRFTSRTEFLDYLKTHQPLLDARFTYEQSLATRDPTLIRPGTCAPCLRPTTYTAAANGERLRDGRVVPNWRETDACACPDRLITRARATIHLVQASGLLPWTRLLLFGAPGPADTRLTEMASETTDLRNFAGASAESGFHFAIAQDFLQHVPALGPALAELCNRLLPGGRLIFTIPFHQAEAQSTLIDLTPFGTKIPAELRSATHKLGWDLLDMLREAGFRDAAAYLYWSEELGYLGAMNFIFRAVK